MASRPNHKRTQVKQPSRMGARPLSRKARSVRAHGPAAAALLLLGAFGPAHALVLGVTEGVTYKATDNQIEAKFAPLAEALSAALKQPVTIKMLSTYNASREAMAQQQVDVVFVHPAHLALEAVKGGKYKSIAWTTGYTDYKVSLLCKGTAQPISNWQELNGKSLVMPDADSITSVITRAMLRDNGLKDGAVKVSNTRYQEAVPFYVENGFTTYGATASSGVVKAWEGAGGKTCAQSRPVPIKQWLASSKLDAATAAQVREALLDFTHNDAGKRALTQVGYSGFQAPAADVEKSLMGWLGI